MIKERECRSVTAVLGAREGYRSPWLGGGGWLAVLDAKQRLVLPNGTGPDTIRKITGWNDKILAIGTCGAHRQLFSLPVS